MGRWLTLSSAPSPSAPSPSAPSPSATSPSAAAARLPAAGSIGGNTACLGSLAPSGLGLLSSTSVFSGSVLFSTDAGSLASAEAFGLPSSGF